MHQTATRLLTTSLVLLLTATLLPAQTPSYVADVDPGTVGIQTSFATTTSSGTFTVDIYMFSPGPPPPTGAPPVDFDAVVIATEFDDGGGGVLGLVPGSMVAPLAPGTCPVGCTIMDGAPMPVTSVGGTPIAPGAPIPSFGFAPGAAGPGGAFAGTDGGTGIANLGGFFFGGGAGLPPAGTPILLHSLMLSPLATGTSDVAPIGGLTCPPPPVGPPFCGPGAVPSGPAGIWPAVAEIISIGGGGVSYIAAPVPAAAPFVAPINPGTVTVSPPLPVEFTAFDALVQDQDVLLTWQTASESDNAGFEIQHLERTHATLPIDNWVEIGFVEGAGSTLEAQQYSYRVTDLEPGLHRFRLKQVDFDGATAFSDQVEVLIEVPGTHVLTPAYPNPFNPSTQLSLTVAREQIVSLNVYDVTGRFVQALHNGTLAANTEHQFRFEAESLPGGLYMIRATGENFTDTQHVMLVK